MPTSPDPTPATNPPPAIEFQKLGLAAEPTTWAPVVVAGASSPGAAALDGRNAGELTSDGAAADVEIDAEGIADVMPAFERVLVKPVVPATWPLPNVAEAPGAAVAVVPPAAMPLGSAPAAGAAAAAVAALLTTCPAPPRPGAAKPMVAPAIPPAAPPTRAPVCMPLTTFLPVTPEIAAPATAPNPA
jgi:hypothetical protein